MDPLHDEIALPMSQAALDAFRSLPHLFLANLTAPERVIALESFLHLDFASKGTKTPRELQILATIAVRSGKDLLVRSGTGSGKTIAMILPVLMMSPKSVAVTISPLRLIQDNHVTEFSKFGIPSIAINCYTPDDPSLWKSIKNHTMYRHYSVSPEQCGPYEGHIPRFAKLLHDPKWVKAVKLLQIDEAHFIATTGQAKGKEAAFRPAFSDLGERVRVHLPSSAVCTAYSASMPNRVCNLLMKTLRMEPTKTVKLELSTNRPNLIYATIPMIGSINNFTNLHFLFRQPFPANYLLPKSMIFLDDKKKAAKLARHLNSELSPALAAQEPFRHYHSSMSKHYLEDTVARFRETNGGVRCLIATESASNGFDIPNIRLIVLYGVPKTEYEKDQRGGRGGRDGLECLVLTIAESWAFENLAVTDPAHEPGKKEQRTEKAVIAAASSKKCRRKTLADHNDDNTPTGTLISTAITYSGRWCCDNHDDDFDISAFLPGPLPQPETSDSDAAPKRRRRRRRYRPVPLRQPLMSALEEWRQQVHASDPVAKDFPQSYILDSQSIVLLA
ncbi:P-loop containing nucleoside triphosphate hydrolase protein [Mycena maculata]|uniref:DNA 3'-5' helicase n=1 Tax=Mycena maculata TaxID=230809 RepID=A0AAD7N3W2_9AGAR|nr:P-loop containing nucleoside triphosphate hydrolase protein [Mycena maculata]